MSDLLWQLGAMETAELISKKDVSTRGSHQKSFRTTYRGQPKNKRNYQKSE